jgi:hypothetical protein
MVEITLPIVLQIIQTVSISVGIIYYLFIMRNVQKSRQRENLFLRLQSFDKTYNEAREDLARAHGIAFISYRKSERTWLDTKLAKRAARAVYDQTAL